MCIYPNHLPMTRAAPILACALVSITGCATVPDTARPEPAPCLIDLSHSYDHETVYWPTSPSRFTKRTIFEGMTPGGYYYSAFEIGTPEHGGTHIDAPIHFAEGQDTTEAIPLERLIAPGVVIDMRSAADEDPDALLTVGDIEAFELAHGAIESGTIVLVHTGWAERWPDPERYLGDHTPGDASNLHFPGISAEAARSLVSRKVAAVGIDTASIDHGPSKDFMAHRVLMESGIPGFENVAELDAVPPRGAQILALPMKIAGGSGGPLRIVAVVPSTQCAR